MGAARVSLPGGCAIGTRPVDLLLMALEKLGAQIEIDAGYAVARAPKGLIGAEIEFPKVTVGGTHVAIMAASTARGATLIRNAACEPEVADLAAMPQQDGRAHPRRRHADDRDRRRRPAQRRASPRSARPDRSGNLCDRGRDDRRRHCARGRERGPAGGGPGGARPKRARR